MTRCVIKGLHSTQMNCLSLNPISAFQYHLEVYTGTESKAGTDANVSMQLFGQRGDTGLRKLLSSKTNSNKFEQGQVSCDLERIHIVIIFGN